MTRESRLQELPNLGPFMVGRLEEIGLSSVDALRQAGAVHTYSQLKFRFGREITLNALWALDGALSGTDWRAISPERKVALKAALNARHTSLNGTDRRSSD